MRNATTFYKICEMKVKCIESMNRCQGTIFGRTLLTETTEKLMDALKEYNCTRIKRIESLRERKRSSNGFHILTFGTRTLPESILSGYERFNVKQYYPNPLRCTGFPPFRK
jgi:hypothetical protein